MISDCWVNSFLKNRESQKTRTICVIFANAKTLYKN